MAPRTPAGISSSTAAWMAEYSRPTPAPVNELHLVPGLPVHAAGLLDSYLARADMQARVAQLDVAPG